MRFGILGPVVLTTADGTVTVGQPRHRAVLAYLLLHRRPATMEQLVQALWGHDAPATARPQIHVAMSALRAALRPLQADHLLVTRPDGYQLTLTGATLDADLFAAHVTAARAETAAGRPDRTAATLEQALSLWRGEPLAGVRAAFAPAARRRLEQQRLDAVEQLADAHLTLDRPDAVITLLAGPAEHRPPREHMAGQLMRALHRCGRTAEALDVFDDLRRHLAQEYGTDPGPQLRQAHLELLRSTPDKTPLPRPHHDRPVPRQLPAPIADLIGRRAELAHLDAILHTQRPNTPAVAAVVGTAGVGKTTLALHWAHRVADRFPDGQLHLHLRGHDPSGRPMTPAEAVRSLLDGLTALPEHLPDSLDAQVGILRSELAGRRMLIVLDNARDAAQVEPLLPGTASCMVVVTSRSQLSGLVTQGAQPVPLNLLSAAESRELLAARLGTARLDQAPAAVAEIVDGCARLPLALAILCARAAAHPTFPLTALAAELRDARSSLDTLGAPDPATDLRAVLSWSYHTLTPAAARLFGLLGLHFGPDVTAPAAASLAGLPATQVRPLLAELTRANLASEQAPGRWVLHDLLRAFAGELAEQRLAEPERTQAQTRLLEHCLHTARAADQLLQPFRAPVDTRPAPAGVSIPQLDSLEEAISWFDTETVTLLAAVATAAHTGADLLTWQLAWTLETYLDRRARWQEWHDTQQSALIAAARLGDTLMQAGSYRGMATALSKMQRRDQSYQLHEEALRLSRTIGDLAGMARSHRSVSFLLERDGRYADALTHTEQALALSEQLGDPVSAARTRNLMGWLHAQLGDYPNALEHCEQAAEQLRSMGNRNALAHTLDSLGFIHHRLADYDQAARDYRQAVRLYRQTGHRYGEAESLIRLGEVYRSAGRPAATTAAWRVASAILDGLPPTVAVQLRAGITELARG